MSLQFVTNSKGEKTSVLFEEGQLKTYPISSFT